MKVSYKIVPPVPEDAENIVKTMNLIVKESDYLNMADNKFHLNVEEEKQFIINLNKNQRDLLYVVKVILKGLVT